MEISDFRHQTSDFRLQTQTIPSMSKSLYKSTIDFLISKSINNPQGNHLRPCPFMQGAGMICSCIRTKTNSLEGLVTPETPSDLPSKVLCLKSEVLCLKSEVLCLKSEVLCLVSCV